MPRIVAPRSGAGADSTATRRASSPSATARRSGTPRCGCRASSTPRSARAAAGRPARAAEALAGEGIEAIFASDLARAYDTAQALAAVVGLPIATDTGLRERSFGIFEGHTYAEIDARWPADAARWRRHDPDVRARGRRDACVEFSARAVAAATRIAASARAAARSLIVTHGGVLDCLYRAAVRPRPRRAALVGARQRRDQPAALHRRALHPGRLERHRAPRRRATLDDGSEGDPRAEAGARRGAAMRRAGRRPGAAGRRPGRGDRHAGAGDRPRRDGAQPARRWPTFARGHGVRLRPHAKMHKCAAIARLQRDGRRGRRLRAEDERGRGAGRGRRRRHLHLQRGDRPRQAGARRRAWPTRVRLAIAVDSVEGIERLAAAVARSRQRRSTCSSRSTSATAAAAPRPPRPASSRSASSRMRRPKAACASPACRPTTARPSTCAAPTSARRHRSHAASLARAAQASISAAGIACPLVTGAGTGTFAFDAASGVWGELQAGSYLFMDRDYADNAPAPNAPRFEHALFVKSQVMSRGAAHAVVDAGHKSHAIDSGLPRVWQRELAYANGGDEHGILRPHAERRAGRACRRSARRSGSCPATAIRPSTCTTATSRCAAASPAASSRRCGRSRRAAASADAWSRANMTGPQIIVLATPVFLAADRHRVARSARARGRNTYRLNDALNEHRPRRDEPGRGRVHRRC